MQTDQQLVRPPLLTLAWPGGTREVGHASVALSCTVPSPSPEACLLFSSNRSSIQLHLCRQALSPNLTSPSKRHQDGKQQGYLRWQPQTSEGQLLLRSWQAAHAKQGRDCLQLLLGVRRGRRENDPANKQPASLLGDYQVVPQLWLIQWPQVVTVSITIFGNDDWWVWQLQFGRCETGRKEAPESGGWREDKEGRRLPDPSLI